ncbi:MAG: peptidoglycan DD-metalloendopeptidase family protein [Candidatus Krumholzibacteria bacterium]|nr:peptidoglycan DD-metalloendopeptidase family protein [Candidatus Krumholzibacteria bacterium]
MGRMMNREKKITIFVVIAAVISAVLITASNREAPIEEPEMAPASMVAEAAPGLSLPVPPSPSEPDYSGKIKKNSSFSDVMTACGATHQQVYDIVREAKNVYNLSNIRPGQKYEIFTGDGGGIEKIRLSTSDETAFVEIICTPGGIEVERIEYPYEITVREVSGIITQSLFASIIEQDLPQELGANLVNIYAWDIDFFTEIRKNDFFRVIYEERRMLDGPDHEEKTGIGRILAAEFNTSGESRYCFLFQNEEEFPDYFDYNGKSLRKQLLKAPLNYTRISSGYSKRRFHPVLHTYAPHLGIDYAAPTGTPVQSTGDGTVMTASRTRANGNYVKIRHHNSYISYYLHLSKFGRGIKSGVKVKQGQTIGYVGATGYATGPHLDYRVKKNGRFVNPRRLKLPPAKPVSSEKMAAFTAKRDSLVAVMRVVPVRDPRGDYFAEGSGLASEAPGRPGGSGSSPLPH